MNAHRAHMHDPVRQQDDTGVLTMLLLRHSAMLTATADNPHRQLYELARDSAENEALWRMAGSPDEWTDMPLPAWAAPAHSVV